MVNPANTILSSRGIQLPRNVALIVTSGDPIASIQVPGEERFALKQLGQTLELLERAAVNVTFDEPLIFDDHQKTGWEQLDSQLRSTNRRQGHLIEHIALQPHPEARIRVDRKRQLVIVSVMMARAYVYGAAPLSGVADQPIQAAIKMVVIQSDGCIYPLSE